MPTYYIKLVILDDMYHVIDYKYNFLNILTHVTSVTLKVIKYS